MKVAKKRQEALAKVDRNKLHSLREASNIIVDFPKPKFDPTVEMHIKLGIDPKKPDQALRGTVSLPHGTGQERTVLALCEPAKQDEAAQAGADYVGLDEYVEKIENGWTDVDVIVASPSVMPQIAKLGRILGPRGLMPNPKSGTVSENIGQSVSELKKGKISFRVDKYGVIHVPLGKASFSAEQIFDNGKEMIQTLASMKPSGAKGLYFRSIYLTATMSPSVKVDPKTVVSEK